MITYEDFKKLELKTAKILNVEDHPNADKLYVLTIDIGEEENRQIVAGLKTYRSPESLVGKNIIVVANMQPATLRGVESNGMLLAIGDGDDVHLVVPENNVSSGLKVS